MTRQNELPGFTFTRPQGSEYRWWMLAIAIIAISGIISSLLPTFESFVTYVLVTLCVAFVLGIIVYAVGEYVSERKFWRS